MSDNELKLKITVDAKGAISGIEQIRGAEQKFKDSTKGLSTRFTELNSALSLVQKGFQGVAVLASKAADAISIGSQVDDVTVAFQRLTKEAGVLSDQFLADLNRATGETLDNFTLLRQANEALQKGLTPDEFFRITAAARELSETMGTDLLTEIQQISQAFETGNVRVLQSRLGIIDLKEAEEDLADTLGLKREELNKEQQVMAARTAIMQAMNDEVERGLQVEADSGDILQQITKLIVDQANAFRANLATNKEFNEQLAALRDTLRSVNWAQLTEDIISFATKVAEGFNYIVSAIVNVKANWRSITQMFGAGILTDPIDLASESAKRLRYEFLALVDSGTPTKENAEKLTKVFNELTDELNRLHDELLTTGEADPSSYWDMGSDAIELQRIALEKLREEYEAYLAALNEQPGPVELTVTGGGGGQSWFSNLFDEFTEKFLQQWERISAEIEQSIGQAVGQGLRLAFDGGNREDWKSLGKQTGSQIGSALGSAWGPVGSAVGGYVGEKFGKGITDAVIHMFGGGRDPGTKARKSIEAWFDTLLKDADLKIIKDDQLIDLEEFDRLGDAFEGNWVDHFNEIAGASADTFSAIGDGLTGVIGVANDLGGQIAYIMAENLGGSLNNLQLLFYKTGLSAEELRDKLLEAFLDGSISADQFVAALNGINQVMAEGIPDGVGMTATALDNLFASSGRGIASLDALRDIFIEAGEIGITTFEDLRANLIAAGESAEQIDALFKVLADAGIGSFDQVIEGSDEFLIGLIANLDDVGFQFATLSSDVDELAEKLDDLEREREIPITLAVSTRADERSQRILDAGALPGVA